MKKNKINVFIILIYNLYGLKLFKKKFRQINKLFQKNNLFYTLNHDVKPKLGRALIWTNFHNNMEKDDRTAHEALPVLGGTKIISQSWIHPNQYH